MSLWMIVAGALGGLGIFVAVRELAPAPARLDAALARLDSGTPPGRRTSVRLRLARRISAELPWLPVPSTDLALLGQDRDAWIASKIICGLIGLAVPAGLTELLLLGGGGVAESRRASAASRRAGAGASSRTATKMPRPPRAPATIIHRLTAASMRA